MGIVGIGDWGQSPMPNTQYPKHNNQKIIENNFIKIYFIFN